MRISDWSSDVCSSDLLGVELPAALAVIGEGGGRVARALAEEDHCLGPHGAVLVAAEAQHVESGLPGDLGRCATEGGHRVAESRPVHVQLEPVALGGASRRGSVFQNV